MHLLSHVAMQFLCKLQHASPLLKLIFISVTATKALVYITCSNWIVKSASQTGEEVIDDNPSLRFTIYQMNAGSLVLKELLTTSRE